MIHPLRTAHRTAFVMLAILLPAILVAGLGARHRGSDLPMQGAQVPASLKLVSDSAGLWQKHAIRTKFYSMAEHPQNTYLVLQPAPDLNEPDLLVYWTANAPTGNLLPAKAQLVGTLATGKPLLLPPTAKAAGYVVLFSSAHPGLFDTARVENLP